MFELYVEAIISWFYLPFLITYFLGNAVRIMLAGGFSINQSRCQNIAEVIVPTVHILPNNHTLLRVGKRNYYIINWLK